MTMKLQYTRLGASYAIESRPSFDDELQQALETMAKAFEVPVSSIQYLLQNGWSQSLQDAFAGPRTKAVKDGEPDATVEALVVSCIEKRIASIRAGEVGTGGGRGRDPIRTVGREMLLAWANSNNIGLPVRNTEGDKEKLAKILDKYIEKNDAAIRAEIAQRKTDKASKVAVDLDNLDTLFD